MKHFVFAVSALIAFSSSAFAGETCTCRITCRVIGSGSLYIKEIQGLQSVDVCYGTHVPFGQGCDAGAKIQSASKECTSTYEPSSSGSGYSGQTAQ